MLPTKILVLPLATVICSGSARLTATFSAPHGTAGSQHIDGQREIAARIDAAAAIAGGGDDQRRGLGALGGRTHALADGLGDCGKLEGIIVIGQIKREFIVAAQISNVIQDNGILQPIRCNFICSKGRG